MWRNVLVVIRREYLQRVRSGWFVIGTALAPILLAVLLLVPTYLTTGGDGGEGRIVVVDETGVLHQRLRPELQAGGWRVEVAARGADALDDLEQRAEAGEIVGFVVLDDLTLRNGEATFFSAGRPSPLRQLALRGAISRAALGRSLEESGVDASSLLGGGTLRVEVLSSGGSATGGVEFAIAYGGAFFLYMVILFYAVAVMRATLEEKTSRIVEIILSSMEPWQLMLGKIVGVGAVSLTQLAAWIAMAVVMASLGVGALLSPTPEVAGAGQLSGTLPGMGMLGLFVGFFILGFFMYSGLYAAVGAMCSTDEQAQQAQLPLIIVLILPILLVLPVIERPTSAMAEGLSLFPLFTPFLMWARVATGGAPGWQVALSLALMGVSVVAIAWVAGRIYKVGILMSGKRPTIPELWRWVRES
ncbi:MAG TPA: ABC transporter permease [Longimicrobiales bacterium]|nr:ABC transporter permease [Longimicrobiales bacterium]